MSRISGRDIAVMLLGVLLGAGVLWLGNDYRVSRVRAFNGQIAYEYIKRVVDEQEAQRRGAPPAVPPSALPEKGAK